MRLPAYSFFACLALLAACNKEQPIPSYAGAYKGLFSLKGNGNNTVYPVRDTFLSNTTIMLMPSTDANNYSISVRDLNRTVVPSIQVKRDGTLVLAQGDSLSVKTISLKAAFKGDSLNLVQEFFLTDSSRKSLMEIRAKRVW